jgi:hypothetical protein
MTCLEHKAVTNKEHLDSASNLQIVCGRVNFLNLLYNETKTLENWGICNISVESTNLRFVGFSSIQVASRRYSFVVDATISL